MSTLSIFDNEKKSKLLPYSPISLIGPDRRIGNKAVGEKEYTASSSAAFALLLSLKRRAVGSTLPVHPNGDAFGRDT